MKIQAISQHKTFIFRGYKYLCLHIIVKQQKTLTQLFNW